MKIYLRLPPAVKGYLLLLVLLCSFSLGILKTNAQTDPNYQPIPAGYDYVDPNYQPIAPYSNSNSDIPQGSGFLPPPVDNLPQEITEPDIRTLTVRVVSYFLGFLGLVAMVALIYGGVLMVISGGVEDNVTKGRNIVLYAAIGIILVLSAYTITNFFIQAVGGPDGGGSSVSDGNFPSPNTGGGQSPGSSPGGGQSPGSSPGGGIQSSSEGVLRQEIVALRTSIERLLQQFQTLNTTLNSLNPALRNQIIDALRAIDIRDARAFQVAINKIQALNDPSTTTDDAALEFITNFLKELEKVRNGIIDFFGNLPNTPENINNLNEQLDLIQQLIRDPSRLDLLEELLDAFAAIQKKVEDSLIMIAYIRVNPFRGPAPLTVVLDGSASKDPTNNTIPNDNFHWSYLDTNGNQVVLERKPITTVTFDQPGKYVVNLRVETAILENGNKAAIDGQTYAEITVEPPAALVNFTLNGQQAHDIYSATLAEAEAGIAFDPSTSRSALGRTFTSYLWDFGDGSNKEERTSPAVVSHFYPAEGNYRVSLTITDDGGNRVTKTITLQVKAIAAKLNISPDTGTAQTLFNFDASRSVSMNGDITEYNFSVIKQGEVIASFSEPSVSYQFSDPGTYQINLTVRDSQGAQDSIMQLLTVTSQAPQAYFKWEQIRESTPSTISFDASGSFDPDPNDELFFDWDFDGNGTPDVVNSQEKNMVHTYLAPGTYQAKLTVRDQHGEEGSIEQEVEIKSILDVDLKITPPAAPIESEITFQVLSPRATSYYYSFGDQASVQSELSTIKHTYSRAGIYNIVISAFDAADNETVIKDKVYIGEKGKPLAIMEVFLNNRELKAMDDLCGPGQPGIIVTRQELYTFDGRLSLNKDGSNRGLNYEWDFGDGTRGSEKTVYHKFDELTPRQCHRVQLTAYDIASGLSNTSPPLYLSVINELPAFIQFTVTPPAHQDALTPLPVTTSIIGAYDLDGRVSAYKFWYFYKDSPEQFGVQTGNKPSAVLTVTARGREEEDNEVLFGAQIVDNDGGKVSNIDLNLPIPSLVVTNGTNLPPEVTIKADRTSIHAGDAVSFYAEARDPQGFPIPSGGYKWDFDGDGIFDADGNGPNVSRIYNIPGEYEVRLKVTSRGGLPTTNTLKIFVERLSKYPRAAFLFDVQETEVRFDARNSQFDPAISNNRLSYQWDFDLNADSNGDGDPQNDIDSSSMMTSYNYPEKKTYKTKLRVIDILQGSSEVIREVNLVTPLVKPEVKSTPIIISSSHGITSLDVSISNSYLKVGDNTELTAIIKNADGSPYNGKVRFKILEGSASLEPDIVSAEESKARTLLQIQGNGVIEILIQAENTIYGTLTEHLILFIP